MGMTIQRMLELLEIEHECMLRGSHDSCDRNCADCDLVQDDDELHEMYTNVIALLKEQEPVKPKYTTKSIYSWECGVCAEPFDRIANYCPNCGRAVKWE